MTIGCVRMMSITTPASKRDRSYVHTTGSWYLAGGRFQNGTLTTSGSAKLYGTNTQSLLSNVVLNGTLDLTGWNEKTQTYANIANVYVEKGITLNTPAESSRACAIANVGVDRLAPDKLAATLLERYKIWTVAIDSPSAGVRGVRITPNLFTTTADLDTLVRALRELA